MKLIPCLTCPNGSEKEGKSFCEFEACYSYLTKCIQNKALDSFLRKNAFDDDGSLKEAPHLIKAMSQSLR